MSLAFLLEFQGGTFCVSGKKFIEIYIRIEASISSHKWNSNQVCGIEIGIIFGDRSLEKTFENCNRQFVLSKQNLDQYENSSPSRSKERIYRFPNAH